MAEEGDSTSSATAAKDANLESRVTVSENRLNHLDTQVTSIREEQGIMRNEQTRQGAVIDNSNEQLRNISAAVGRHSEQANNLPQPGTVRMDSIIKVGGLAATIIAMTAALGWTFTNLVSANNSQADRHANTLSEMRDEHSRELGLLRDEFRTSQAAATNHLQDDRLAIAIDLMTKVQEMAMERTEALKIEQARQDERITTLVAMGEKHQTVDMQFAATQADVERLLKAAERNQPETVYNTLNKRLERIERLVDIRTEESYNTDHTLTPGEVIRDHQLRKKGTAP